MTFGSSDMMLVVNFQGYMRDQFRRHVVDEEIPEQTIRELQRLREQNPTFTPDACARQSQACGAVARWLFAVIDFCVACNEAGVTMGSTGEMRVPFSEQW